MINPEECAVFIDTETSGLPHEPHARVLSIGAVCVERDTGAEISTFTILVCPELVSPRQYEAAKVVHGIELSTLVSQGASEIDALTAFHLWWDQFDRPALYAFNAPFDRVMLSRMGLNEPEAWGRDVMEAAADHIKPGNSRISLVKALAALGLEGRTSEKHDALEDARLAHRLAMAIKMLNSEVS